MDVTQALKDTENALRDFVAVRLEDSLGQNWLFECGVTPERLEQWSKRKADEERRQKSGVVEERLLYYADFYDLKTIIKKNWQGDISDALGSWKRFEVFFDELTDFRDPDAHRRELLPHQEHLALGIAGDIRSRLVRWRSGRETPQDVFPRIESVRDSLGNQWIPDGSPMRGYMTGMTLHPGDQVDFVVTARDPEDLPLQYGFDPSNREPDWIDSGTYTWNVTEENISARIGIRMTIKSPRPYHAGTYCDDSVWFWYSVLPRR